MEARRTTRTLREPTYPGALSVAAPVVAHMARQVASAQEQQRGPVAQQPGTRLVEALVDAAFWASFRREEGQAPRISLAFVPPEDVENPLMLARPLSLDPDSLARLAPAVERPGIHLGVWREEDELYVWGTTRHIPVLTLVVEVLQPGLLVVKHRRLPEAGKFANVAVLEGDSVKVVDERSALVADCPPLLSSLLGYGPESLLDGATNVLVRLAMSMREHGHGGALLVVPGETRAWRDSIVWPVRYLVDPPHTTLADAVSRPPDPLDGHGWRDRYLGAVEEIAGLTAVDGATVISESFELLAFGVKIGRAARRPIIEQVTIIEPILGDRPAVVHPTELGGTRHLSAAQFVQDQPDALALVASQDGRFTVFAWSACEEMVQAHRIEALLL